MTKYGRCVTENFCVSNDENVYDIGAHDKSHLPQLNFSVHREENDQRLLHVFAIAIYGQGHGHGASSTYISSPSVSVFSCGNIMWSGIRTKWLNVSVCGFFAANAVKWANIEYLDWHKMQMNRLERLLALHSPLSNLFHFEAHSTLGMLQNIRIKLKINLCNMA